MCKRKLVKESWKSYCARNPRCFSCPSLFPLVISGSLTLGGGASDVPGEKRQQLELELDHLDQQATSLRTPESMFALARFLRRHGQHESAIVTYYHVLQIATDADGANINLIIRALKDQAKSLKAVGRTAEANSIATAVQYIQKFV